VWVQCRSYQRTSVVLVSDVGGYDHPEWAWWLGGAFVHEAGIGLVIFRVSVCGAPRFLAGVVGGGEECL